MEKWLDIHGFEGWYQVSSEGRVRSLPRKVNAPNRWGHCVRSYPGVVLSPQVGSHGYAAVGLRKEGVVTGVLVHRLVCAAFHGPCPEGKSHVAHINGDATDNREGNLYWATVRENVEDTRRHGNMRCGERSNLSKLTADDIRAIRARADGGETGYAIAKSTGLSKPHVYKIIRRETWTHV